MKSDDIINDQINLYRDNFKKNAGTSLGTFQNDRQTQYLRFKKILAPFLDKLNKEISLHDVGCGSCDLYEYMLQNSVECDYSGTEVVQDMIDYARNKYPGIELFNRDILKEKINQKYDFVVFSGGLYYPGSVSHEEWKQFVFGIITRMFEMSKIGISFNLLTTYSTFKADDLFYLSPSEIIDYCVTNLSRFVNFSHDYPLYEWTMTVYKKDHIKDQYPEEELKKYLK